MRIHICFAYFTIYFSLFYDFNQSQYILLFITIALVLFAEIINTSIEFIVDLQSPGYSDYAKIAKDVSAGAVLVCAIISVLIGYVLFYDLTIFRKIIFYHINNTIPFIC